MATGACGINCDVCQLNLLGQRSSCGPGRSDLAAGKCAAQKRTFGHPCAILEFPPRISILFDRSIDGILSSPAIWSLVTLCTYYLLKAPGA